MLARCSLRADQLSRIPSRQHRGPLLSRKCARAISHCKAADSGQSLSAVEDGSATQVRSTSDACLHQMANKLTGTLHML
jgi:hypothetical protein